MIKLPAGWKWVKLKNILKEDRRTINPHKYPDKEFFLVTMDCVESDTGRPLKVVKCRGGKIKSIKYKFNTKHILYGKLRPYLNKVYLPDRGGICTTEFIPFIATKAIREYVAYYLRKRETVSFAMSHVTGTRQPRVTVNALLEYPIPLPPLEEQKRIAARIEELVGRVEEAQRLRHAAREGVERIMQAALHKVFSKAEREGWEWVKLGNVCEIIMGQSPPSDTYNEEGIGLPFFQGKIEFGEVYPRPKKWCSRPMKIAKPNDALIAVRAPVGPTNLCREECCIGRGLAALRPDQNKLSNWFLLYVLRYFKPKITQIGKGSTFGAITKKDLIALEIPLPHLEEQKRIVAYFDRIRETAESLMNLQQRTEEELERLVPAILDRAFKGKL